MPNWVAQQKILVPKLLDAIVKQENRDNFKEAKDYARRSLGKWVKELAKGTIRFVPGAGLATSIMNDYYRNLDLKEVDGWLHSKEDGDDHWPYNFMANQFRDVLVAKAKKHENILLKSMVGFMAMGAGAGMDVGMGGAVAGAVAPHVAQGAEAVGHFAAEGANYLVEEIMELLAEGAAHGADAAQGTAPGTPQLKADTGFGPLAWAVYLSAAPRAPVGKYNTENARLALRAILGMPYYGPRDTRHAALANMQHARSGRLVPNSEAMCKLLADDPYTNLSINYGNPAKNYNKIVSYWDTGHADPNYVAPAHPALTANHIAYLEAILEQGLNIKQVLDHPFVLPHPPAQ